MHLQPFRPSGGAPTPHWLKFWVLLLFVPACFVLVTMPMTMAAVAIFLTFGVPLAIWLALHAHDASELAAQVPGAIRFAAGTAVTGLGLAGLFAFSAALALAILGAYVVTVGRMTTWGKPRSGARPGATTAPTDKTPPTTDDEAEPTSIVVTHDLVRQMTDAELCHAWRRSFVALQRARGVHLRTLVVQTRQLLLDEVDARHPAGLQAWLSSGARSRRRPRPVHRPHRRRQRSSRGRLSSEPGSSGHSCDCTTARTCRAITMCWTCWVPGRARPGTLGRGSPRSPTDWGPEESHTSDGAIGPAQCEDDQDPGGDGMTIQERVEELLAQMTPAEKAGQLTQYFYFRLPEGAEQVLDFDPAEQPRMVESKLQEGAAGSLLFVTDPAEINRLQRLAVEGQPAGHPAAVRLRRDPRAAHHLPGADRDGGVLGPRDHRGGQAVAAREARAVGIHWTFAPMVDIARDPRWGRIVEGAGEDPYLGAAVAAAQVRGFQGPELGAAIGSSPAPSTWPATATPSAVATTTR